MIEYRSNQECVQIEQKSEKSWSDAACSNKKHKKEFFSSKFILVKMPVSETDNSTYAIYQENSIYESEDNLMLNFFSENLQNIEFDETNTLLYEKFINFLES
jgi:hypothetical protein